MRHRGKAVLAERDFLEPPVGWVLVDALQVLARPRAVPQLRRVAVGDRGMGIQFAAGEGAKTLEVRLQVRVQGRREVQREQVRVAGIGTVQVDAPAVGDRARGGRILRCQAGSQENTSCERSRA